MVSSGAFAQDPLRTLRLARLACELGFSVDEDTIAAARASSAALTRVAPERVFIELKRVLIADRALVGLELMDAIGATEVVLPEVSRMRGVGQSVYHHLDVYEHTRAVLAGVIELEQSPERWLGEHADAVSRVPGRAAGRRAHPGPGAALRRPPARRGQARHARRDR